MEKIYKEFCRDTFKSHRNGLLPYMLNGKIKYQDALSINGNWGKFVCDFGYISNINEEKGALFFDSIISLSEENKWIYRFKYTNLIKMYNFIKKYINNGIILKKIYKNNKSAWTNKFNEIVNIYDYVPYSYDDFQKNGAYEYEYIGKDSEPSESLIILLGNNEKNPKNIIEKIKNYNQKWNLWLDFIGEKDNTYINNNYWGICKSVENDIIGILNIPLDINGDKVPNIINFSDISVWLKWFEENENKIDDCCIFKEWTNKGGDKMFNFLKESLKIYETTIEKINSWETYDGIRGKKYLSPIVDMNILLTDTYRDNGIMTIYKDDSYIPKIDSTIKGHFIKILDDNYIESKLDLVRSKKYFYDDNSLLPGIFEPSDGKIYKVTMNGIEETIDGQSLTACDEIEKALNNPSKYCTSTIVEEVIYYLKENNLDGYVYTLPFYKTPLKIPYIEGQAYNISKVSDDKCYGDYIISIANPTSETIEIDYNIGGNVDCISGSPITDESIEKHGITLKETYLYYPNSQYKVKFNNIEFYIDYEKIDFEGKKTTAYSNDLGLERNDVLLAKVTGLYVDDFSGITKSILFKKEDYNGLKFAPKENINIEINRGSAAAFEPHFKLSECNTMEDLENYGNNYFNL